jgi:hypothetical protein
VEVQRLRAGGQPGLHSDNLSQKNKINSWASVAYAYNPGYSGGRDQEDCSLKTAQANNFETLSQKNPSQKRAGGATWDVSSEFKPQYCKTKPNQNQINA